MFIKTKAHSKNIKRYVVSKSFFFSKLLPDHSTVCARSILKHHVFNAMGALECIPHFCKNKAVPYVSIAERAILECIAKTIDTYPIESKMKEGEDNLCSLLLVSVKKHCGAIFTIIPYLCVLPNGQKSFVTHAGSKLHGGSHCECSPSAECLHPVRSLLFIDQTDTWRKGQWQQHLYYRYEV